MAADREGRWALRSFVRKEGKGWGTWWVAKNGTGVGSLSTGRFDLEFLAPSQCAPGQKV